MNNLFEQENESFDFKPLAYKMRPTTLDEFYGQEDVVGKNSAIGKIIERDAIASMSFFLAPGGG